MVSARWLAILCGAVLLPAAIAQEKPARPAIRVVELSGTPKERGVQHGKALKAEIHALLKLWKADLKRTYKRDPAEFVAAFYEKTDFEPAIEKWAPGMLDEVRGIAEGAGVDYETMFVFQLIDELWAQGRKVTEADKCTTIGVDARPGQPTIVAQNLDIPRFFHGFQTVLHIKDGKAKLQTLVVTVPGLVGANGMNSARVAVGVNTILQVEPCADGLPVAFVVRGVLMQKSWPAARKFVYDVRHASGQAYTVGGRDVVRAYECSAHRVVRYAPFAGSRFTYHTNHPLKNVEWSAAYRERAEKADKEPAAALPKCPRFDWLQQHFKKGQEVTLDAVLQALRSKGKGVPICNDNTFACTVMLLGDKPELRVSAGGADKHRFQSYRFE